MLRLASRAAVVAALVLATPMAAYAAIIGSTGMHPIPPVLGPYTTTAFPLDPQPLNAPVTAVASPLGGSVGFGSPLFHQLVTTWAGGATWGGGYAGDVYNHSGAFTLKMTLPADTLAFYFFAEPTPMAPIGFTATAFDESNAPAVTVSQTLASPTGSGYFAFYATGANTIGRIEVNVSTFYEFAVGEFGIARRSSGGGTVPEPGIVLLLAVALAAMRASSRARG